MADGESNGRTGRCGHPLTGRQLIWCGDDCQKLAARAAQYQARFETTIEEYDAILAAQGGVCPICLKKPAGKNFPIDHDHKTGLIRGIPCLFDNLQFIGRHADAAKFRRAAEYLENPPAYAVIGQRIAPGRPRQKRKPRRSSSKRITSSTKLLVSPTSPTKSLSSAKPSKTSPSSSRRMPTPAPQSAT